MDCLFCKIIKGEIPCKKIYEDDNFWTFLDIDQSCEGHTLIVPKKHITDYTELTSDTMYLMFQVANHISHNIMNKMNKKGISLLFNYGEAQEVKHVHLHLLPDFLKETSTRSVEEIYNILKED